MEKTEFVVKSNNNEKRVDFLNVIFISSIHVQFERECDLKIILFCFFSNESQVELLSKLKIKHVDTFYQSKKHFQNHRT